MIHTIVKFDSKMPILDENRKKIGESQGYIFRDEKERCIIVVYGEGRRDFISKYLTDYQEEDKLCLKYHYLNI